MKLRDFLDVRVICATGSLRKAAAELGITQPTLSARIAHLEGRLGTPLFERAHGRSRPTDLALFIARRAELMADEADRLARAVQRLSSGKEGLVRIGLGPAIARTVVGRFAASIMARSPAISLEIVAGSTHQLADALVRHELDLLVCERLDRKSKAVSTEVLYESTMVAVARPEHPLCATPPADLVGLLAYPLVTSHVPHPILDVLRRDYDIDLDSQPGRIVCSDFEMLVRVVSASPTALTVGPRFTFAPELKTGIFAVIDIEFPFRNSICLHTSRDAYPLPAVTRAAEIIRELFAEMRAR